MCCGKQRCPPPPSSQGQGPEDENSKQRSADVALRALLSLTSQALFSISEAGYTPSPIFASLLPAILTSLPNCLFVSISLIVRVRKKQYQYCFSLLSIIGILAVLGEGCLGGLILDPPNGSLISSLLLFQIHSGFYFCCTIASLFMCHFILKMLTVTYYGINPFIALISACHSLFKSGSPPTMDKIPVPRQGIQGLPEFDLTLFYHWASVHSSCKHTIANFSETNFHHCPHEILPFTSLQSRSPFKVRPR